MGLAGAMNYFSLALLVAFGGAVGSVGRWSVGLLANRIWGDAFPWGTMIVNIIGSFVIGVAVEIISRAAVSSAEWRALVVTGVLGGFTTFSSFSLDTIQLIDKGESLAAFYYVFITIVVSFGFAFIGVHAAKLYFNGVQAF